MTQIVVPKCFAFPAQHPPTPPQTLQTLFSRIIEQLFSLFGATSPSRHRWWVPHHKRQTISKVSIWLLQTNHLVLYNAYHHLLRPLIWTPRKVSHLWPIPMMLPTLLHRFFRDVTSDTTSSSYDIVTDTVDLRDIQPIWTIASKSYRSTTKPLLAMDPENNQKPTTAPLHQRNQETPDAGYDVKDIHTRS